MKAQSSYEKWSGNFSIVFDYCVGGMLDLAKSDCAQLLWLAKTVLKEAGVLEIWFSHVPWTDESAHANKENMMENIQQYLSWVSRPVFLEWPMWRLLSHDKFFLKSSLKFFWVFLWIPLQIFWKQSAFRKRIPPPLAICSETW